MLLRSGTCSRTLPQEVRCDRDKRGKEKLRSNPVTDIEDRGGCCPVTVRKPLELHRPEIIEHNTSGIQSTRNGSRIRTGTRKPRSTSCARRLSGLLKTSGATTLMSHPLPRAGRVYV